MLTKKYFIELLTYENNYILINVNKINYVAAMGNKALIHLEEKNGGKISTLDSYEDVCKKINKCIEGEK